MFEEEITPHETLIWEFMAEHSVLSGGLQLDNPIALPKTPNALIYPIRNPSRSNRTSAMPHPG